MVFDLYKRDKNEGTIHCKGFILWPKRWNAFNWQKLNWKSIPAQKAEIKKLPDKTGVYAFVINPEIADAGFYGIIGYIGQTKGQTLRKRCSRYFLPSEHNGRLHIGEMMDLWPENLVLHYTEIMESKVKQLEDELLMAFLPPYNRRFPGKFNKLAEGIYHK